MKPQDNPLCDLTGQMLALIATGDIASIEVQPRPFLLEGTDIMVATAALKITVLLPDLIARDDEAETPYLQPVSVTVTTNDEDPLARPFGVVRLVVPPSAAEGTAVISDDGQAILFTPAAGFAGPVNLRYEIERTVA